MENHNSYNGEKDPKMLNLNIFEYFQVDNQIKNE